MFKWLSKSGIVSHRKIHQYFVLITLIIVPVKNNIEAVYLSYYFIWEMRLLPFLR